MKGKIMGKLLAMTACAALLGAPGAQAEETDILKELETANSLDSLAEKYGRIAYRDHIYYADGTEGSAYLYKDFTSYVYENDYYTLIDQDGDVYGYNNEEATAFRYLFVDDAYEEFSATEVLYVYDEDETLISQEEKDGLVYVYTETTSDEVLAEFAESYGYETENIEKISYCYQLDPNSLEIREITSSVQMTDGTENTLWETSIVEDAEEYVPEEQLKETVFGDEDIRTYTAIADAGTDQEQVYTQTISKGNIFYTILPSDYDQTLYSDAEYTTEYTGGADTSEDICLYVRSQAQ